MAEFSERSRLAGIVARRRGELVFVPAETALSIVERPVVTRVPGTELEMALIAGRVTSVVDLGGGGRELVLCDVGGEPIALAGLNVVAAGFYESSAGGVRIGEEHVPRLDVQAELGDLEARLFSRRTAAKRRGERP